MMIEIANLSFTMTAVLLALGALYMAIDCKIQLKAQEKSTHSIQYVPVDDLQGFKIGDGMPESTLTDEVKKALTQDPFEEL